MFFWIIAIALTLCVVAFMARALFSGGRGQKHPAAYDLRVYRDQLKEVERDLARGILGEEDAERARIEISRKVLAADAKLKDAGEGSSGSEGKLVIAAGICAVLLAGGVGLYWQLGSPGYQDFGLKARIAASEEFRANRMSQADAEAEMPEFEQTTAEPDYVIELIEKLRDVVAANPTDLQGLQLLASNEATLGNFKAAYQAQAQLVEVKGQAATADDYEGLAEMMILAANGYVSPEAELALTLALRIDESRPVARYYMGVMMAQTGRPDVTFRVWRDLLEEGPAHAPWIAPIRAQIMDAAALAGVDYELPAMATLSGPSAEDIAAASDLTAEEQTEMVRGMVQNLSDRLATQGGSAQEWARLISSLGILGDLEQASAIWNEAQVVFEGDPQGLALIRDGARRAGVAE